MSSWRSRASTLPRAVAIESTVLRQRESAVVATGCGRDYGRYARPSGSIIPPVAAGPLQRPVRPLQASAPSQHPAATSRASGSGVGTRRGTLTDRMGAR